MMTPDRSILSDITVHMKYAKFNAEKQRRETWEEIVERNRSMHVDKYHLLYNNNAEFRNLLDSTYELVKEKRVLPSMRSMQFGGPAIEAANNRIYNCAFLPVDSYNSFSEAMFLLLGGTGVGYSVQKANVNQIPPRVPEREENMTAISYQIGDSIEGWADAVRQAVISKMFDVDTVFDYSQIRPKGSIIKTSGGRAPGPKPLETCLNRIMKTIDENVPHGERMSPIVAHDIMCHLADAVLSGGIRRAAMISLFDKDDDEMINAKSESAFGEDMSKNQQRHRANNSVVLDRATVTKEDFERIWEAAKRQNYGEPGFYFTNDVTWGTNPCCEIALRPFQFCNLTEINVSDIVDEVDLVERVTAATFLGTLQAGYTDFHYLRPMWKETTEKDSLVGVSMTGIASGKILQYDLAKLAELVKDVNVFTAEMIGIKPAARTTCVKPAGTTSLTLGTSSGIHAWHNDYYIRRIRVKKNEPIYNYLYINHPDLLEDDKFDKEDGAVISIPQRAPPGSVLRHESSIDLLNRVRRFSTEWIKNGHKDGKNTHNVSCTVSVKEDEWDVVKEWMWEHREVYNGISVLPFKDHAYVQAPFEDCDEETYAKMFASLTNIDLTQVWESEDMTNFEGEAACAGGKCEIDFTYPEEGEDDDEPSHLTA